MIIADALAGDESAIARRLLDDIKADGVIWLASGDLLLSSVIRTEIAPGMLNEEAFALIDYLAVHHRFSGAPDLPEVDIDESVAFNSEAPRPVWKQIVPAIAQDQCVGGFLVFSNSPVSAAQAIFDEIAWAFAISFQTRHLQRRVNEASRRIREISEVGRIFADVGEPERTIFRILELAVQSGEAETGALIHVDSLGNVKATGMSLDTINSIQFRSGKKIIEFALRADKEMLFTPEQLAEELQPGASSIVLTTLAIFPLISDEKSYGSLVLINLPAPHLRDRGLLTMLGSIARLAASAMTTEERQNAKLQQERTEQELRAAHTIQENLMPRDLSFVKGAEVAALWKPSLTIGGDYYDVIDLGDSKVGMMIADVSGKGLPAGLLMAACRSYLRVMARDLSYSPAAVLSRLNRLLCEEIADNKFITAAYMILDLAQGKGAVANAGHHPPIMIDGKSIADIATDSGPPLGIMPSSTYGDVTFDLREKMTLLLFTDGLVEAKSRSGLLRVAGLYQILDHRRSLPPKELLDELWNETLRFTGGAEPGDDWTVLAARIGKTRA